MVAYCEVARVYSDANALDLGMCSVPQSFATAPDIASFEHLLATPAHTPVLHEVMEVFGGLGLTTQILIKRQVIGGRNFDIRVGIDLTKRNEVAAMMKYVQVHQPIVIVMSPPWHIISERGNSTTWRSATCLDSSQRSRGTPCDIGYRNSREAVCC